MLRVFFECLFACVCSDSDSESGYVEYYEATTTFAAQCWHFLKKNYFAKKRLKVGLFVFFKQRNLRCEGNNLGFADTVGFVRLWAFFVRAPLTFLFFWILAFFCSCAFGFFCRAPLAFFCRAPLAFFCSCAFGFFLFVRLWLFFPVPFGFFCLCPFGFFFSWLSAFLFVRFWLFCSCARLWHFFGSCARFWSCLMRAPLAFFWFVRAPLAFFWFVRAPLVLSRARAFGIFWFVRAPLVLSRARAFGIFFYSWAFGIYLCSAILKQPEVGCWEVQWMDDEETAIMDTPSHLKPAPKPGDKVQLGMIEVEVMRYVGTGEWVILRALEEHVGEDKVRVGEETGAVAKLRNAVNPKVSSRQTGVSGFYKHVCRCFEKTGVSGF